MAQEVKSFWNEKWRKVTFKHDTISCNYYISNYGRIKSVKLTTKVEKFIKGSIDNRGYRVLNVNLQDGNFGYVYIHKFVAKKFLKKARKAQTYVLHIDFDNLNNHWENLVYATKEEWVAHYTGNPNRKKYVRVNHHKLNETDVKKIKRLLARGKMKKKTIAKKFNVSQTQIRRIETGENWAHVSIKNS
jgi:DNA-binding XRE family transcriptional regulator